MMRIEDGRFGSVGGHFQCGLTVILGAIALLCCLAFAAHASAGPPLHSPDPREVSGLEHACGTAVDSEGDVYVASAGESIIKVFGPDLGLLASIPNSNEPCGLAVNRNGELFVSEGVTGNVVRYDPSSYPFGGVLTYGSAVAVDGSGEAEGISVDSSDNRLYIAKNARIDSYSGVNEVQRVFVSGLATAGEYSLTFKGAASGPTLSETTSGISFDADAAEVKAALVSLSSIGDDDVVAKDVLGFAGPVIDITFTGNLATRDIRELEFDASGLVGGAGGVSTLVDAWEGTIVNDGLDEATGIAAYTYVGGDHYVFAADQAGDQVKIFGGRDLRNLKLRKTLDGPQEGEEFGFGEAGAYLAIDPGNVSNDGKCASVLDQACTSGHLLVYDAAHSVVDEFDASGEFLDRLNPSIADAEPTAMAIDRSGGANDGSIYATTGSGTGAKLLAFEPLAAPGRAPLFGLSDKLNQGERLKEIRAVATDSNGYVYAATGALVHVFDGAGTQVTVFEDAGRPVDLAVDSSGNVYVLDTDHKVTYYEPSVVPPIGATYARHAPEIVPAATEAEAVAVNAKSDRLTVLANEQALEFKSAAEGGGLVGPIAPGLDFGFHPQGVGVYAANGSIYVSEQDSDRISVVESSGTERTAWITGAGCPRGAFEQSAIAVDQTNGHVLVFANGNGAAREYDASGACVAEFAFPEPQAFSAELPRPYDIAIDNSGGPSSGTVYVAFDDEKPNTPDLWAFGPLAYGEPPLAVTGVATDLENGNATLNGSVTPRGFLLTNCEFEYLSDIAYKQNLVEAKSPFDGASVSACAETVGEIGSDNAPVAVHVNLGGLDLEERHHFRLITENKYGPSDGEAALFGPPVLVTKDALPVSYREATLRANVDPSGVTTKYHFEYGLAPDVYDKSTPVEELAPGAGPTDVHTTLTGLTEGTRYHFRIVVENEVKELEGPDQAFETRTREVKPSCPNVEFRTGLSANLPDCRAYELVTPGETNGLSPRAEQNTSAGTGFNNWLVMPHGTAAGERVAYFTLGTLPGFDGTGILDGYRAQRTTDEGLHPAKGWQSELFGPTYEEAVPRLTNPLGQQSISSDQLYSFWKIEPAESFPRTLDAGIYLRTPGKAGGSPCNLEPLQSDFEVVGCGSLGIDSNAESRYVNPGGTRVIFGSQAHLEPATPLAEANTRAIYARAAGASSAEVVSLRPGGDLFANGEDATYVAANENGSAIVFKVGGALYLRRGGQTTEVAEGPNTFAGISEDGRRIFYADAVLDTQHPQPAGLFVCDVEAGPCAGPEKAQEPTAIANDSIFVSVSADGSDAFFTSEATPPPGVEPNENGEEAEADEPNLYAWSAETPSAPDFISLLDPQDFVSFDGDVSVTLGRWTTAINPSSNIGLARSPARSTQNGDVFVFQSHARLTAYDNAGHGQIYRYAPAAELGERLACVSCDPGKSPASADAMLASVPEGVEATTSITNVTDSGEEVFFESPDRLLPEDANDVRDVYEWRAKGAGSCVADGGCLALISSGKGENDSYLYGMSADGHDVFFRTQEKLVGRDVPGSPSIYDARVGGGIPEQPAPPVCTGDACQGNGSPPPVLPSPATTGSGNGNLSNKNPPCRKGKHRVKGRCVKKHRQRRHHGRANDNRRTRR